MYFSKLICSTLLFDLITALILPDETQEVCWDTIDNSPLRMNVCPAGYWTGKDNFNEYHYYKAHKIIFDQKSMSTWTSIPGHLGLGYKINVLKSGFHWKGPERIGTTFKCTFYKSCNSIIIYGLNSGFKILSSSMPLPLNSVVIKNLTLNAATTVQFYFNQLQWISEGIRYEDVYVKNFNHKTKFPFSKSTDLFLDSGLPDGIIGYRQISNYRRRKS